jgi:hypothetical protein
MSLMDGVALIARTAAKRRLKLDPPRETVVQPVATRYFFRGDLEATVNPILSRLEAHLTWRPRTHLPIIERMAALGRAMIALKEVEYLGAAQAGGLFDRVESLIEKILAPLEEEWKIREPERSVVVRVKNLRAAIVPGMVKNNISADERERRWQQLSACHYAQQISHYPRDYLPTERPSVDRVLETVERMAEDLMGELPSHGPLHAVIQVGEPISVDVDEDRRAETDRIMGGIRSQLQRMLDELARESRPFEGPRSAPPDSGSG